MVVDLASVLHVQHLEVDHGHGGMTMIAGADRHARCFHRAADSPELEL